MASSICDSRRRIVRVAVVALLVATPAAASPVPPQVTAGPEAAAEAKLVEGVDLLKRRHFDEALDRFKQAYALVPSPRIHYDFGLAYLGLDDAPRALEAFDAFLAEARDAPADKRGKAERYRDDLRPRVAIVELSADVGAAEVTVDGRALGTVSFPRRLYLPPGSHEVVARAGGGAAPQNATVVGRAAETTNVSMRLGSLPAPAPAPAREVAAAPVTAPAATPNLIAAPAPAPARASIGKAGVAGLSAAALGAASVGTGLVFGILAMNEADAVSEESRGRQTFVLEHETSGLRYERLETVFLSVGAVVLVAGVSLYLYARHHAARAGEP